jgi:hypothetical protein
MGFELLIQFFRIFLYLNLIQRDPSRDIERNGTISRPVFF